MMKTKLNKRPNINDSNCLDDDFWRIIPMAKIGFEISEVFFLCARFAKLVQTWGLMNFR